MRTMYDSVDPAAIRGEAQMAYFITRDPATDGSIWVCPDGTPGPRRRVYDPAQERAYAATMTDTTHHMVPDFVFDRMRDMEVDAAQFDALAAAVAKLQAGVSGSA